MKIFAISLYDIGRKSIITVLDHGVVSATSFITGVLMARLCTISEFGYFTLAMTILYYWDGICASVVTSPFVVYYPRKTSEAKPGYVGATALLQVMLLGLGAILFCSIAFAALQTGSLAISFLITSSVVTIAGYSLRQFVRHVYFTRGDSMPTVYIDISFSILQLGGILLLFQFGCLSYVSALILMGIAQFVASLFGIIILRDNILFRKMPIKQTVNDHYRLGKWLILASMIGLLSTQMFPWVIQFFWNTEEVGMYGACLIFISIVNPLIIGLGRVIVPKMSHAYAKEGKAGLARITRKGIYAIFTGTTAVIIVSVIFAEPFMDILFNSKYSNMTLMAGILGLNMILYAVNGLFLGALTVLENTHYELAIKICSLIFSVIIGIPLVCYYGALGGAAGLLITRAAVTCLYLFFYRKSMS